MYLVMGHFVPFRQINIYISMVYFNFQALYSKSIFFFQFKLLPVIYLEFIFNDKKQQDPSFTSKFIHFIFD